MLWKNMFSGTENAEPETDQVEEKLEEKLEEKVVSHHNYRDNSRNTNESSGLDFEITIHLDDENQVGRAAILLAATTSPSDEHRMKEQFATINWKSVATEVGGLAGDLPQKLTRALVGASLNAGVIEKNRREMHALMHAAVEAMNGFIAQAMLEVSIGAKIGIVRNSRWIAVAVMGDTAYHAVAHHERCGLGVMHL